MSSYGVRMILRSTHSVDIIKMAIVRIALFIHKYTIELGIGRGKGHLRNYDKSIIQTGSDKS